jgi:hypothetical protein
MAEQGSPQDANVNWAVVGVGIILLMLANIGIQDTFLRLIVSAIIMLVAVFWSQSRPEAEVENPVLDELHKRQDTGLDRRKYGHLRSSTGNLLEHVRQMNKIAVDGREGKLAPRHAKAELDRIAAKMRDLVEDIRKTAGVPTPMGAESSKEKAAQPQVVIPKPAAKPPQRAEPPPAREPVPPRPAPRAAPSQPARDADDMLDEMEAKAKAEARRRAEEEGGN